MALVDLASCLPFFIELAISSRSLPSLGWLKALYVLDSSSTLCLQYWTISTAMITSHTLAQKPQCPWF
jgi:hypothetical protein